MNGGADLVEPRQSGAQSVAEPLRVLAAASGNRQTSHEVCYGLQVFLVDRP
jgi:hypothetical protein